MSRGVRLLGVVVILGGSAALAAVLIWQEVIHGVPLVLGLLLLTLGVAVTALHRTAGDAFLGQHFGEPGAAEVRRLGRSGWVAVVLGAALLGLHYLDRRVQAAAVEAQFEVAFNRGLAAAQAGDWPTAADAFSEAIRLNPGNAKAYRHRGVVFLRQGEQDRALEDLSAAIRLDPDDANAFHNRGVAYSRKGDWDRALADFTDAIRLRPDYAKAYLARSRVYSQKGDDARATADRQRALELDPALDRPPGDLL